MGDVTSSPLQFLCTQANNESVADYSNADLVNSSDGNNIHNLLTTDNGAVRLMMGIRLVAPHATFSSDQLPQYLLLKTI